MRAQRQHGPIVSCQRCFECAGVAWGALDIASIMLITHIDTRWTVCSASILALVLQALQDHNITTPLPDQLGMQPYLSLNGQTSSMADVYLIVSSFAVTQHFLQSATKSAGQQDQAAQQQQLSTALKRSSCSCNQQPGLRDSRTNWHSSSSCCLF
jgi:hypothetical protein